jgi:DNA-binding YbaB/EbfC family protein
MISLLLIGTAVVHGWVAVPPLGSAAQRAHTTAVQPRMLFGGGGNKEGGGGLGGMGNMMETIKKAQEMGVKVKELQAELVNTEVEATSADGGVTVVVSGAQVPMDVKVTDEMCGKGAKAVSQALTAAMREAHKNSMEYSQKKLTELYSEIGLPMPPS